MVHPMFLTHLMPGDPPHSLLSAKQVPHSTSHVFNLSHAWWFTTLSVICKTSATWYIPCLSTCPMPGDSPYSLLSAKHQVPMPSVCSHNCWWFTTFLLPAILQVHTFCGFSLCKQHRQFTTCLLPAILQVHTSYGFSLCKHDIGSSPQACCRQYCKFIHSVVSACATTHRQFTTFLLPAILQVHTFRGFSLLKHNTQLTTCLLPAILQVHTSRGFSLCKHKQFTTCLLPAIRQVHTSYGFSLCKQHRQFTTCLLPAILQVHTSRGFSLCNNTQAVHHMLVASNTTGTHHTMPSVCPEHAAFKFT